MHGRNVGSDTGEADDHHGTVFDSPNDARHYGESLCPSRVHFLPTEAQVA